MGNMYLCTSECLKDWFINGDQCVHTCPSYAVTDGIKTCQTCKDYWYYDNQTRQVCVS